LIYRRNPERRYLRPTAVGLGVWELASGRRVARLPAGEGRDFRVTPGGRSLVVLLPGRLSVWGLPDGKEVLSWPVPSRDGPWEGALAVSPDGRLVATAHPLGSIMIWDLTQRPARMR